MNTIKKYSHFIVLLACGVVAFTAASIVFKKDLAIPRIEFILTAAISCSTTFTGFVLTALSILVGLSSRPLLKYLYREGYLKEFYIRCALCMLLGLLMAIYCIIMGAFIDGATDTVGFWWIRVGLTGAAVYFFSLVLTGYQLIRIVIAAPQEPSTKIDSTPSVPDTLKNKK